MEKIINNFSISIVTVTLNNISGLMATSNVIMRILQQSENVEWIIVDGASTDGTVDYFSNISNNKIKFFSAPDNGIYDAMYKGVNYSNGTYVNFMNSGDIPIFKNYLIALLEVEQNKSSKKVFAYGTSFENFKYYEIFIPFLLKFPGHQAMFFPKDLILRYGFDFINLRISNDLLHKAMAWRDGLLCYKKNLVIVQCDPYGISRRSLNFYQYLYRAKERYLIGFKVKNRIFGIFSSIIYLIWNIRKVFF